MIIGGHAVCFHGHIRTTEDADIVFRRDPASERGLTAALVALGARWVSAATDPATGHERLVPVDLAYVKRQHLMMLVTEKGFLDVFDYIPGFADVPVDTLFADAVSAEGLPFVSLAWLKKIKQAAGRPQDLADLENLA